MSSLCVVPNKGGPERRSSGANRERDVSKYDSVIAGRRAEARAAIKDDGNGGELEKRARLVTDAAHTTEAAILVCECGVTERPGRAPFAFVCSSFVSNKQNKEATKGFNQHIE